MHLLSSKQVEKETDALSSNYTKRHGASMLQGTGSRPRRQSKCLETQKIQAPGPRLFGV